MRVSKIGLEAHRLGKFAERFGFPPQACQRPTEFEMDFCHRGALLERDYQVRNCFGRMILCCQHAAEIVAGDRIFRLQCDRFLIQCHRLPCLAVRRQQVGEIDARFNVVRIPMKCLAVFGGRPGDIPFVGQQQTKIHAGRAETGLQP